MSPIQSYTYDGFGINDTDEYRTRLATFSKTLSEARRKELATQWTATPDLLHACQAALSYFDRSRQWHAPEAAILLAAIRKGLGK